MVALINALFTSCVHIEPLVLRNLDLVVVLRPMAIKLNYRSGQIARIIVREQAFPPTFDRLALPCFVESQSPNVFSLTKRVPVAKAAARSASYSSQATFHVCR